MRILLFFFNFLSAINLFAQPVPYKLLELKDHLSTFYLQNDSEAHVSTQEYRNSRDTLVAFSEYPESEIHAAINPNDSNHVIVAAIQNSGLSLEFSIYTSFDFGLSWQKAAFNGILPDEILLGGGDPILGFDEEGNPYFSWLTLSGELNFIIIDGFTRINRAVSYDGGLSWQMDAQSIDQTPIQVILILLSVDSLVDKQWIVTDLSTDSPYRGQEYAIYAKLFFNPDGSADYQIVFRKKTAGADAYLPEGLILNNDLIYLAQFASIEVDKWGNIHVIFCAQGSPSESVGIYYTKSIDGGTSFSALKRITELQLECFPNTGVACSDGIIGVDNMRLNPCVHIRADKSNGLYSGNLYVTFTANGIADIPTEGADVYLIKSTDEGEHWSNPMKLSSAENPNLDDFYSYLEVNTKGIVNVSWYDRREDPDNIHTNYYTSISKDGGNSFETPFSLSSSASNFSEIGNTNMGFGIGEYNATVSTVNHFLVFWGDGRSNDGNINVFMAKVNVADSTTVALKDITLISENFSVDALFPNPVRESISLKFHQTKRGLVHATVIDLVNGNTLKSLNVQSYEAGTHLLHFPGLGDLPSGNYACLVQSEWGAKTLVFEVVR